MSVYLAFWTVFIVCMVAMMAYGVIFTAVVTLRGLFRWIRNGVTA